MIQKFTLISLVVISALILGSCATLPTSSGAGSPEIGQQNNTPGVNSGAENLAGTGQAAIDVTQDDPEGNTAIDAAASGTALTSLATGVITPEDAAGLAYMREEEKLAHDVYALLHDTWGLPIFQNISTSEQTHSDAILALLERYNLSDPTAGKAAGEFSDTTLQNLYNQLTAQGSQSLAQAFKVGAAIEEIDILDLQERSAQTSLADIQLVYQNLEKGSRNHLRNFVKTLQNQTGETYTPQYLSEQAYQAIVSSGIERGGAGQGGYGQGGNGQGGSGQAGQGGSGRGGRGGQGGQGQGGAGGQGGKRP